MYKFFYLEETKDVVPRVYFSYRNTSISLHCKLKKVIKWYFVKRHGVLRELRGTASKKKYTIQSLQANISGIYICYGMKSKKEDAHALATIAVIGKFFK